MFHNKFRKGMTLLELMIVVGIVAILFGIMAFFVTGNRANNAQVELSNDLENLFEAQRMRATSMNVATYVQIDANAIEPRIGDNSICTAADNEQYPIKYEDSATSLNVGIDLSGTGNHRSLDSSWTSKYIDRGNALTRVRTTLYASKSAIAGTNSGIVVCFQPNGQAYFMSKNGTTLSFKDSATSADIIICATGGNAGGFEITITGLGMISSSSKNTLCQNIN